MPNLISLVLVAGLASASFIGLAQQTKVKVVPVKPTSPTSGSEMYTTYCATCHGAAERAMGRPLRR